MDYSPWLWAKSEGINFGRKRKGHVKRSMQNGASLSSVAPSSEEL